jgi:SAM-dependent methyltransferase
VVTRISLASPARTHHDQGVTGRWDPSEYARNASFVPVLGAPLLELLAATNEERVLDLGCGEGSLTQRVMDTGATVVGIDASPEMVAAAVARGVDARVGDATALTFEAEFDAVLSNAVLHWIADQDAVADGVRRALKPGGRFVAEFGGFGNVAAIGGVVSALRYRSGLALAQPWYYPTPEQHQDLLLRHGFAVEKLEWFPRMTRLDSGIADWLRTFGRELMVDAPDGLAEEAERLLEPWLRRPDGVWYLDYLRLRFVARKL